jgi:hypothetical protein
MMREKRTRLKESPICASSGLNMPSHLPYQSLAGQILASDFGAVHYASYAQSPNIDDKGWTHANQTRQRDRG